MGSVVKNVEDGKFVGINWLTGRKIYLTPDEEKVIKRQRNILIWTLILVIIGLSFLSVFFY